MPLTGKGEEIMSNMKEQYGSEKGESVFYASRNAGKITGVDEIGSAGDPYPQTPFPNFDPYALHGTGGETE